MKTPIILLADNGSGKAESVLNLRNLAEQMSSLSCHQIYPVSLQHAEKIAVEELHGKPADTLAPFLRQRLSEGKRVFLLIPLFFGVSRALTAFIPQQLDQLQAECGAFTLKLGEVLYPLPQGEPRVARILYEQILTRTQGETPQRVVLVDHGSPLPQVSEVRTRVAEDLSALLGSDTTLTEAAMERRQGSDYDFNGELLNNHLTRIAETEPNITVDLALLFLSPGRHAGPAGDIQQICERLRTSYPNFKIRIAPLVGEHGGLANILHDRLNAALADFYS